MTKKQVDSCRRVLALMLRNKIITRKAYLLMDKRLDTVSEATLAAWRMRRELVDSLEQN